MTSARMIQSFAPDRDLAEPVYKQLIRRITKMIESGELPAGQSLPSERALAEKLNLSRATVRRCYEELRAKNIVINQRRAGTAVSAPPKLLPQLGRLKGFTEEMRELGMVASTQVLEKSILHDLVVAPIFGRPVSARFLKIVRLRLGNGEPLSREIAWYDLTLAPELAGWDGLGSAYELIQDHQGVELTTAEQTIEAVLSTQDENEAFGFPRACACLLMKRKTFTTTGQIVEYVEGTFRGDKYTYRIQLG